MNTPLRTVSMWVGGIIGVFLLVTTVVGIYWSVEPETFDPESVAKQAAAANRESTVVGYTIATTMIELTDRMLNKPGGLLTNDLMPPGIWLDNMPSFEEGVIFQLRDLALVMRNDWSRSQSQSSEDADLVSVHTKLSIDTESWIFPAAESEYADAVTSMRRYRSRLADGNSNDGQFYARADNLAEWLSLVQKRLGSLTLTLSQSVDKQQQNLDLEGDPSARQSKPAPSQVEVKTSWMQRDNVFYEARGQAWALMQLMKAVQVDFADVLRDKNASVSVANIITELQPTLDTVWSPMILNGDGFGLVANHSLVMASYLARSNAAIIQLRQLLDRG